MPLKKKVYDIGHLVNQNVPLTMNDKIQSLPESHRLNGVCHYFLMVYAITSSFLFTLVYPKVIEDCERAMK